MTKRVSTVVTGAADSYDLAVLATFKDDWQITDTNSDAFLGRAITRASEQAAQYCNRVFSAEAVTDTFYAQYIQNAAPLAAQLGPLQLSRHPIVSIASVTENGTVLIAGTDYYSNPITGELFRLDVNGNDSKWSNWTIVVVYIGGYQVPAQTVPSLPGGAPVLPIEVSDAVGRMVFSRYAERARDPFVKTVVAFGIGTTEYTTSRIDGNMTDDVTDILDNYRSGVIA